MSHINRDSAENLEYERNEINFFKRLMNDCLVKYTRNGKKCHIYVICPAYIKLVRREYAFWGTYIDYYIRHLKKLISDKGFDWDMAYFTEDELGDYASTSKLHKLYKEEKGLK